MAVTQTVADTYGLVMASATPKLPPNTTESTTTNAAEQLGQDLLNAAVRINYQAPGIFDPDNPFNGLFNYCVKGVLTSTKENGETTLTNRVNPNPEALENAVKTQAGIIPEGNALSVSNPNIKELAAEAVINSLGTGKYGAYSVTNAQEITFNFKHKTLDKITGTPGIGDSIEKLWVKIGVRYEPGTPQNKTNALQNIVHELLKKDNHETITAAPKAEQPTERSLDALVQLFMDAVSKVPSLEGLKVKFRAEITRTKPVSGINKDPEGGDQVTLKAKKTFTIAPHSQGKAV